MEGRSLGKQHKLENNVKTYLGEVGCENMNWNDLSEDRIQW